MALLEAVWIWAHSGTISSVQSMFCPGTGSALKILLYSTEGGMNICHAIWVSGSPVTTACQRRQSALFRISSRWLSVSLRRAAAPGPDPHLRGEPVHGIGAEDAVLLLVSAFTLSERLGGGLLRPLVVGGLLVPPKPQIGRAHV